MQGQEKARSALFSILSRHTALWITDPPVEEAGTRPYSSAPVGAGISAVGRSSIEHGLARTRNLHNAKAQWSQPAAFAPASARLLNTQAAARTRHMASAVARLAPGASGPKKLVVKTLQKKDAAAAGDDPLERSWPALRDFLGAVHSARVTVHSFQELYGAVESLVLAKQGARLYERLVATCSAHIAGIVSGLASGPGEPTAFLAALQKAWVAHCEQMVVIRNVFLYLDRTYVRDAAAATSAAGAGAPAAASSAAAGAASPVGTALLGGTVLPLWDMGLHLLRERLVSFHADVLARIVSSVVARIGAERRGEAVDRSALASACRMLLSLRLYSSHLEQELYADADQAFAAEGVRLLDELDVPTYLVRAEGRLREERDRAAAVLDGSTSLRRLVGIVEGQLLSRHGSALLEKGFAPLAEAQRVDDLRRLHVLLGRVGRTPEVRKHFADYVKVSYQIATERSMVARTRVSV